MVNSLEGVIRWLRYNLMYLGNPPWDTGVTPPELIQFIRDHPPGRAIDLGCGTGTNLVALSRAGWQVTGVDFVPRAAAASRRRLAREYLPGDVRTGDVTHFEIIRGFYDLVLDIGCYHGLPAARRATYRANLPQILLPDRWFLIYAHWAEKESSKFGIFQEDLDGFLSFLEIIDRQDSQDRRGRQATWIKFRKKG